MSELVIQPELMVELSSDEQQLLSGGRRRRFCPQRVFVSRRCGFYVPIPARRGRFGRRGGKFGGDFDQFDEFEDEFD